MIPVTPAETDEPDHAWLPDDDASHAEEQRRLDAAANDPAVKAWARGLSPRGGAL